MSCVFDIALLKCSLGPRKCKVKSTVNEIYRFWWNASELKSIECIQWNTYFATNGSRSLCSSAQSIGNGHECIHFGRDQSFQQSKWSDIIDTSHLEDIISFLEKQDLEDPIRCFACLCLYYIRIDTASIAKVQPGVHTASFIRLCACWCGGSTHKSAAPWMCAG